MLTDVPKPIRVAHRNRYEDLYRVVAFEYQVTAPIVSCDGSVAALSFNRSARNFSERDRSVLDVLLPHLRRAYANARLLEAGATPSQLRQACREGFGLTGREAEVAFWIAQAKTNVEIATILGVAPRTVEKHVEHVLAKVGVENRVALSLAMRDWSRLSPLSQPRHGGP